LANNDGGLGAGARSPAALRPALAEDQWLIVQAFPERNTVRYLHWKDDILVVTNLKKRQEIASSETPEAVRERVRRYRERHAVTEKPPLQKERPDVAACRVSSAPGKALG